MHVDKNIHIYIDTTPVNHLISPWTESIHTNFYDWDRNNNNKCSIIHGIEFSEGGEGVGLQ